MIDPKIWESAYDKGWKPEEITVLIAAISAADDEGRGRISQIKRNVSEMFSDRKLKKVIENLQDSVQIYDKIYFFLPNFSEYQSINHPKPSKIPPPDKKSSNSKNNNLAENDNVMSPGTSPVLSPKNGAVSEVKLSKVNLKRSEVKEELFSFNEIFLGKIKNLFKEHTKYSDPNLQTFVYPIYNFFEKIPENMNEKDIEKCLTEVFKKLTKNIGINMDFLVENIQKEITAEHEKISLKIKNRLNGGKEIPRTSVKQSDEEIFIENRRCTILAEIERCKDKIPPLSLSKINEFMKNKKFTQAELELLNAIDPGSKWS